tara:strand:+ start:3472 stop:4041 length:570 start_codon:yes stop_codon:yes gene_type:complete
MLYKGREGDRVAQAKIIERYKHIARSFARRFKGNYPDADLEDLYQEGLESILKALRTYGNKKDSNGEPYPFWRTAWFIIRSDASTKRRKRKYREEREMLTRDGDIGIHDSIETVPDTVNERIIYSRAWEVASTLKPIYWIVWRLYYGRDMREVKIAEELNITRQAVNHRLQKARQNVGKVLRREGYDYE